MTDIPGNVTTTAVARVGDVINDSLETIGDRDWFRLTLTIGQEVKIQLAGVGPNGVTDTYLRVVDGSGRIIFENDDAGDSPFSSLAFSAPSSGVFFIVVGAFNDAGSGDYQLRVTPYQPPAEATLQQIADQMTNGYWGGASHHFDVTQGGSISVNYGTLPYEEKSLAQAALLE